MRTIIRHCSHKMSTIGSLSIFPIFLLSCAATEPNQEIVQMEQRYVQVSTLPSVAARSTSRLTSAQAAIDRSEAAHNAGDQDLVRHELTVAGKTLDIIEKQAQLTATNSQLNSASERRQALLLQARERDAALAQNRADAASAALAATSRALDERNRDLTRAEQQAQQTAATLAQRNQALSQAERRAAETAAALGDASRTLDQRNQQLTDVEQRLAEREAQLNSLQSQAQLLASELEELRIQTNERGMVLTLSDIVFDVDSADLRSGSERSIDRIAEFIQENDGRQLVIEGFTDSTGDSDYNQALSVRRADSVQAALAQRGVDRSRMSTEGFGEEFPVATNDTSAGRQANRRVEIIIGDAGGAEVESR